MRALVFAGVIAAASTIAHANGRPPGTSTIHFRYGHDQDIAGGMTFGLVISHDGGATWQWMCERAVGYGGIYDPQYIYADTALFATTFDGLHVSRDSCTFASSTFGKKFVSAVTQASDGAIFAALGDPDDGAIYRSTDDGMTFTPGASPGMPNDFWQSIAVAPSDTTRVYLSGFRADATLGRKFLLFRSDNAATSFTPLAVTAFTAAATSTIDIAGISPTDPDVVFARVTKVTGNVGDAIYRSTNAGVTFTKVLDVPDSAAAFVVRKNGDVVIGTPDHGFYRSTDGGATFQPHTTTPGLHVSCLAENAAGELWACTQNFGTEGMGMASSTDGVTWTSKLRYSDIQQPIACGNGTDQHDVCQIQNWCPLRAQLGITSTALPCASLTDTPPEGDVTPPAGKGCCDSGAGGSNVLLAGLCAALLTRRRQN
jgi:photosystem II stability/assembly factor-like uncharacterized protein